MLILNHPSLSVVSNCMNKTALQDVQKTLNLLCKQIDAVDPDTNWVTEELVLSTSSSGMA